MAKTKLITRTLLARSLGISLRSSYRYEAVGLFAPVSYVEGFKLFDADDIPRIKKDLAKVWRRSPPVWKAVGDAAEQGGTK